MIEAQRKIIDTCSKILEKAKETSVNEIVCGKLAVLGETAREGQLVVPIIGAFSSGKSSLINSLLGKSILPVAITPETSIATELHYSPADDFIEAVKEDGSSVRYPIEEIATLTRDAAKYLYARVHLNNSRLREIEPLVFVDMPGFDSPLDAHNKAIMAYLSRGCHYIVLSSSEEGTVTASLMRRLKEIDGLGRGFSFFISKTDLKPRETVDELIAHFQEKLADSFDLKEPVRPVNANSTEHVMGVLKKLNADSIFLGMYREPCSLLCNEVIDNLNTRISTSRKDAAKIQEAIIELRGSIDKLKQKAESETENMRRKYSVGIVGDIINDVGRSLESAIDELAGIALAGNQEETTRRLNEIVRSTLTVSIREKLGKINQQIIIDFSESLKGLDKVMKDLEIDEAYVDSLAGKIQSVFELFQSSDVLTEKSPENSSAKTVMNLGTKAAGAGIAAGLGGIGTAIAGTGIATALGLTATVINPLIGAVVIFLPEIIRGFMKLFGGESPQQSKKEAISSKLAGEIFPQIKRRLRDELPLHLEEQVQRMIDQVRAQFEEKISLQQADIEKAIGERSADIKEAEEKRKFLEDVRTYVQTIATSILEWV
jgi:ribosome biogenesis GTPase A